MLSTVLKKSEKEKIPDLWNMTSRGLYGWRFLNSTWHSLQGSTWWLSTWSVILDVYWIWSSRNLVGSTCYTIAIATYQSVWGLVCLFKAMSGCRVRRRNWGAWEIK